MILYLRQEVHNSKRSNAKYIYYLSRGTVQQTTGTGRAKLNREAILAEEFFFLGCSGTTLCLGHNLVGNAEDDYKQNVSR